MSHSHSRRRRLTALVGAAAVSLMLATGCASSPATDTQQTSNQTTTSSSSPTSSEATTTSSGETPASEAPSTSEAPAFPVTVTGDNGDVTIAAQPVSIASLSPTATEMLYAIGAGDQVTVVDDFSDYPSDVPEAKVDAYQLNIEALTAYDPDLVITSFVSPDQQAAFDALGMPALGLGAPMDMDGAYAQILALGQATGHVAEAQALVDEMTTEIADITAQMPEHDTPYRYYYELDQTYYSVTSDTFIGQLLRGLGMESIADSADGAAEAGGYPQLTAEFILNADPDYILLSDSICCQVDAAAVAARDGWSTLSAVADGRVIELDDSIASRWGPRTPELLRVIVKAVTDHPTDS